MRHLRRTQLGLFVQYPEHQLSKELLQISNIIERHPEFVLCVHVDLVQSKAADGDIGMTAEQVLKSAILKFIRGLSYRELAFNIADSVSTRFFLELDLGETYKHSCLQDNISRISEETWSMISAALVADAREQKIEPCQQIRVDSTITDSKLDLSHSVRAGLRLNWVWRCIDKYALVFCAHRIYKPLRHEG